MATDPGEIQYRSTSAEDYDAFFRFLSAEGGVPKEDSRESISAFLSRNGRYCFTATDGGRVAGIVLCGSDGRSARIYHLLVEPGYRRRGIAHTLVRMS